VTAPPSSCVNWCEDEIAKHGSVTPSMREEPRRSERQSAVTWRE